MTVIDRSPGGTKQRSKGVTEVKIVRNVEPRQQQKSQEATMREVWEKGIVETICGKMSSCAAMQTVRLQRG